MGIAAALQLPSPSSPATGGSPHEEASGGGRGSGSGSGEHSCGLLPGDTVLTAYRDHGFFLALGGTLEVK